MKSTPEMRAQTAAQLTSSEARVRGFQSFVGLDGFVDEILHVVDKRESAEKYTRLAAIEKFGQRLSAAAGQSTNVELVSQVTKLGGNGPIMANALASFGIQVNYLGILGYPNLHPVFANFAKIANVHSIAEPGYTDALEFEDGKIMLGKHQSLKQMNWANILERFGRDKLLQNFRTADLVGFVNWTMLPHMSEIWEKVHSEIFPALDGAPRRWFFVDLADPEKRTREDVLKALNLLAKFQDKFDVILGLNEKESYEIGRHLGLGTSDRTQEGLQKLCQDLHLRLGVNTLVVHPTAYALASAPDGLWLIEGPFTPKPRITTGAGDHFNSGFCLGKLIGLPTPQCLLAGVATSGFYVRTGQSPALSDLAGLLHNWPV